MTPAGLYIHVPFCKAKCPYCDFYSLPVEEERLEQYTRTMEETIAEWGERCGARPFDTVYFGGGTPSLLGGKRIGRLIRAVQDHFTLRGPEITLEANPDESFARSAGAFAQAGVNRLSFGLQSAIPRELKLLRRRHTAGIAAEAVRAAQAAGIRNISLDLMLALPEQTEADIARSVAFCRELGATHVSAYLLKVEPGTAFYQRRETLGAPDDDRAAELYLFAVRQLGLAGYRQYEISSFAENRACQSRHNLKYWNSEEYLGLGPAAHSFYGGRRFYWPRSLRGFLEGAAPVEDGPGGSFEEYMMLRLRLTEGLLEAAVKRRFGRGIPPEIYENARKIPPEYVILAEKGIRLTASGFLVSNSILAALLP